MQMPECVIILMLVFIEYSDETEELWTDEVKASWIKFQEEQKAKMEAE